MALSFVTVEAGGYHSCGISPQQQLWCWGRNFSGQLGVGQASGAAEWPRQAAGLEHVTAVSAGEEHTCAIAGGRAWCWGNNGHGQLGLGMEGGAIHEPMPVGGELAMRTDVTAISAGTFTSCAIAGGDAWCWGQGDNGQIGNGSSVSVALPQKVLIDGATSVETGEWHTCAIAQGSAWCWGAAFHGLLGDGAGLPSAVPVAVVGLPDGIPVERLAVGLQHNCVVAGGKAWCWGYNFSGQLGTGNQQSWPVAVEIEWNQGSAISDIDTGVDHTCAIDGDGRAWCWGSDAFGQLGNDMLLEPQYMPTPIYPPFASNVTSLSGGRAHTCGVADGTTYCWGRNVFLQLGAGVDLPYAQLPIPVDTDGIFDAGFDP